jgi:hypothetical protein
LNQEKRIQRIENELRKLTIGNVFNKPKVGLASLFQKLVRLRARDENGNCKCFTCGKVQHWTEMDAGHFVGRNNKATILDVRNCHPQCVHCNRWVSGAKDRYLERMVERYGGEVAKELMTRTLPKNHIWDRRKLAELKIEYLDELKRLLQ